MSVKVEYGFTLIGKEDFTPPSGHVEPVTFHHEIGEAPVKGFLFAASSPPVTKVWSIEGELVAGVADLDLRALTDAVGAALNLAGLKVCLVKFYAAKTNTESIRLVGQGGAGVAYPINGEVADKLDLEGGGVWQGFFPSSRPVVSDTAWQIRVSSDDADAKYCLQICAG